jgi:hypothetical protein
VSGAQTPEEAEVVYQLLKLANITAVVHLLSQDLRPVRMHVDPESAERATIILSSGSRGGRERTGISIPLSIWINSERQESVLSYL